MTDRIAVIDLETTGLSPWRHDRVVEIAIVVVTPDGTILTEYETLLNPRRDIGPTSIHQISASDVVLAPDFAAVAGDILAILADVSAVAGHNVSFDKNFLIKEYERIGVSIPDIPLLCTCRLFGRNNLRACCEELGIEFDGSPHRALSDARTTARLVSYLCCDDPKVLDEVRLTNFGWPSLPPLRTPCVHREHARRLAQEPPNFLQRIAKQIHHDVDAETPSILAYMTLIDRVLEDRAIDPQEEEVLVEAALNWKLSPAQITTVHSQYITSLAVAALADGHVSDSELRDLEMVAGLLGQDTSKLEGVIRSAAEQLASSHSDSPNRSSINNCHGQRVCFTGELQSTIGGQPLTRELAESLATQAGLIVTSGVTKKLDILVVADPNTQSGKAKKARSYGVRVLSHAVFWNQIGVTVD